MLGSGSNGNALTTNGAGGVLSWTDLAAGSGDADYIQNNATVTAQTASLFVDGTVRTSGMLRVGLESTGAGFNRSATLTFFGWDDRLGSGFQNASCDESQWAYRFLAVKEFGRWAGVLDATGVVIAMGRHAERSLERPAEMIRAQPNEARQGG